MSTLKCTTISKQDGTASVPTDTVINGSAKAFVLIQWTGGVPGILSSFNVASVTDIGVGQVRLNYATPFPNANYVTQGTGWYTAATGATFVNVDRSNTTTSSSILSTYQNGAVADLNALNCTIFGN